MKTTVLNVATAALFLFVSTASFGQKTIGSTRPTSASNAPSPTTCLTVLESKTGKVYSAAPGVINLTNCPSDRVTIKVNKTDGKAQTQVNVYVNNVMQPNPIEFPNGTLNPGEKKVVINNVRGKNIMVKVVNQSVGNTFSYSIKINGQTDNIIEGNNTGSLVGNAKITLTAPASCGTGTTFKVVRTSGVARATIRVWEKQAGGNYTERLDLSTTLEQASGNKEVFVNSTKPLKIEVKNVSVGNLLGYKVTATPMQ